MDENISHLKPEAKKRISDESVTTNVDDLIQALVSFKTRFGGSARVSLTHDDGSEIHPYQFTDVHHGWHDYEVGDVCTIELTQ